MGTIAFPNIPADAQAIAQAPQNALAEYARVSALKQQTALEQQQTQTAQLENQKQQLALNDQQAMTKAMQQWDGKDMSALPDLMRKNGISAGGYLQAQQGIVARQQALTNLDKDQLANMQAHHDAALGVLTSAQQVPDEQLSQYITDSVNGLVAQGHLSQQDGNAVIQHAQSMPPDQFRPWLSVYEKSLQGEKAQIAQAQSESETNKNTAEEKKIEAETAFANKQVIPELGVIVDKSNGTVQPIQGAIGGMMPPQMMESKYVALQAKKNAGQPIAPEDAAWMKGYEKMKTLVPQFNLNMQGGLLSPEARQMAAQYYQQTGALPSGMRSPAMSASILNSAAGEPGTTTPDIAGNKRTYAAQTALQKSATSGEIGKNITAYNTAISHAQQLQQAADALQNNDVRGLNKIGNALGYQFGSDATTNFNVIKNALAGEISKVFKGGEASDAEIRAVEEPFSTANSPQQLKGAIDNAIHLMNSKRDALKQQYEQGMQGKPNFGDNTASGKTLTLDSLRKAAQDHKVSLDEARRQAIAQGYTIQ